MSDLNRGLALNLVPGRTVTLARVISFHPAGNASTDGAPGRIEPESHRAETCQMGTTCPEKGMEAPRPNVIAGRISPAGVGSMWNAWGKGGAENRRDQHGLPVPSASSMFHLQDARATGMKRRRIGAQRFPSPKGASITLSSRRGKRRPLHLGARLETPEVRGPGPFAKDHAATHPSWHRRSWKNDRSRGGRWTTSSAPTVSREKLVLTHF